MGGQLGKGDFCAGFKRTVTDVGEKVLYMPTGKRDSRLSSRYLLGVLSGKALQSNDRERDLFRRLPGAVRKDPELLLKVRGAPWAPCGGETGPNVALNLDPVVPLEQLHPRPVAPVPVPRRLDNRENVELSLVGAVPQDSPIAS